jgi:hypothetical protein
VLRGEHARSIRSSRRRREWRAGPLIRFLKSECRKPGRTSPLGFEIPLTPFP